MDVKEYAGATTKKWLTEDKNVNSLSHSSTTIRSSPERVLAGSALFVEPDTVLGCQGGGEASTKGGAPPYSAQHDEVQRDAK
jgi:hypothetical protein